MTSRASALVVALLLSCAPRAVVRIGGGGDVTREVAEGRGAEAAYARAAAEAYARTPRAWLWRVEGCADVPSHVLGTMHVGVRFGDALPPPLDRALYDARAVLLEIDFRRIDTVAIWREVATTPPPTVESVLSPGELALLFRAVGDGVPEATLRHASPGRVADYLYDVRMAEAEAAAEGREPVPGAMTTARLDQSIASWAISMGLPFVGLETLEERLAILDGIYPPGAEVPGLLRLVADAEGTRAAAARARAAYLGLDEAAMRRHVDEMPERERTTLLEDRNRLWHPRLLAEVRAGGAFAAVGLAHLLLGEASVLALLEEAGCTTSRVLGDGGFVAGEAPPVVID